MNWYCPENSTSRWINEKRLVSRDLWRKIFINLVAVGMTFSEFTWDRVRVMFLWWVRYSNVHWAAYTGKKWLTVNGWDMLAWKQERELELENLANPATCLLSFQTNTEADAVENLNFYTVLSYGPPLSYGVMKSKCSYMNSRSSIIKHIFNNIGY